MIPLLGTEGEKLKNVMKLLMCTEGEQMEEGDDIFVCTVGEFGGGMC